MLQELYYDFYETPRVSPKGFEGALATLLAAVIRGGALYLALT